MASYSATKVTRASRSLLAVTLALATVACINDEVIIDTAPFRSLQCEPYPWTKLRQNSARFAEAYGLRYSQAEYSVLLTNERLNFIVIVWPGDGSINASGIARSLPKRAEAALFARFLTDLHLKCVPTSDRLDSH